MLDLILPAGEAGRLYNFFFSGSYPLALQLGIINGLCVIAIVLMRVTPAYKRAPSLRERTLRALSWMVIFANFFLIFNKDYHFIADLA